MARHNHSRITVSWVGLVILIVGVILLLSNLGYINANMNDIIRDYWPVILIIIGITQIVGRDVSGGIFMIILGGVFLMVTLDKWYWHDVFDLWPLILVWIGVCRCYLKLISSNMKNLRLMARIRGIFWTSAPFSKI